MRPLSILLALMLLLTPINIFASPSIKDMQKQKSTIQNKINILDQQKRTEKKKLNNAIEEKKRVYTQQKEEEVAYEKILTQKDECETYLKDIDQQLKISEEKYKSQINLLKKRLIAIYENSDSGILEILSESRDLIDFMGKVEIISIISEKDKELVDSIGKSKKDIEFKKREKERETQILKQIVQYKQNHLNKLQASRSDIEKEIDDISAKLRYIEEQEDSLIEKSKDIQNSIRNMQKGGGTYTGGNTSWPVPSSKSIASYFGMRMHPILKKNKMHTGIDISASSGDSIISINKGTVIMAGWQGGYGNTVVVDHGGGISSLYAHCSKILVSTGQKVQPGTIIAKVGSTGMSTGPHLHFEIRKNGEPVNPLNYIN